MNSCTGFVRQGFGSKGATGWLLLKLPEASPCPREPTPDGSKMDPQLAKAEPIRESSRTSGITDLTGNSIFKGIKRAAGRCRKEYGRITALQTPKSMQKEEQEVLQTPEQRPP